LVIVIEFYSKPEVTFQEIIKKVMIGRCIRKRDGLDASAILSVSLNHQTRWTQLLIDDEVSSEDLEEMRMISRGLSDNDKITEFNITTPPPEETLYAPIERERRIIEREMT